ncbi:AIG2-like family protein [Nitrosospira sp. Nl5]|uniref:gamma-glutamylcyclotransferase n=1 Tax=Nitrosospira sp. Nl5 TaxID=200120 RepID=UPI0008840AEB|nr:gamma-glutamylcyclotransferase [Nitrosospira sp. Nl5]SCY48592.1 AIG2-like family protein [Nitrosospira sp. Nl5]
MLKTSANTFLYFAYGANMLSRRIQDAAPSAVAMDTGFIQGHRFTFGKVSRDGSGECDIEVTNNLKDRVYGVLYKINVKDRSNLNDAEGLGTYSEANVQVVTATDNCPAMTYIARYKDAAPLRPYQWYKGLVIAGAVEHDLPNAYVEWLRTFEAQVDSNSARRAEGEALLFGNIPLDYHQFNQGTWPLAREAS